MLITFSGLDRAGTSTLAEWLRRELERDRREVVVLHDVGLYSALRTLRRWLGGGPPSRAGARSRAGRLRDALLWNRPLRRAVYLVDLLILMGYRCTLERLGGRVLILDRYCYDTLVEVARGRAPDRGMLARITPRPDLPVFLEPDGAAATPERGDGYRRVFRAVHAPLRLSVREPEAARRLLACAARSHLAHEAQRLA